LSLNREGFAVAYHKQDKQRRKGKKRKEKERKGKEGKERKKRKKRKEEKGRKGKKGRCDGTDGRMVAQQLFGRTFSLPTIIPAVQLRVKVGLRHVVHT
jgi:hypothetical protein